MSDTVTFELPKSILASARMTVPELKVEIALMLYQQKRISIGKAHELAAMSHWQFQQLLAAREIAVNYDVEQLEEDAETLQRMGLL